MDILGTDGNDSLTGTTDADTITGREGNDTLSGGAGADIYRFDVGFGQDTITGEDYSTSTVDTVHFGAGILPTDVRFYRDTGNARDLIIAVGTDTIRVDDQYTGTSVDSGLYGNISQITFADSPEVIDLLSEGLVWEGTEGNDTILGSALADNLRGGLGDDDLQAGAGDDTYLFDQGFGQDTITGEDYDPTSPDTVVFGTGILPADIRLTRDPANLRDLLILVGSDVIRVDDQYSSSSNNGTLYGQITQITFVDSPDVIDLLGPITWEGTEGDDAIYGGNQGGAFVGKAGNDLLSDGAGDAVLRGGLGDDDLQAGAGDDTLIGGQGNDTLRGGTGADTYVFAPGFGTDVVIDFRESATAAGGRILFEGGIGPDDITFFRLSDDPRDLLIRVGEDAIRVEDFFNSSGSAIGAIERIDFENGQRLSLEGLAAVSTGEIENINRPPTARDDAAVIGLGETAQIQLFENDFDPDGNAFEITAIADAPFSPDSDVILPSGSTVSITPAGLATYTPSDAFVAGLGLGQSVTDTFNYQIGDGRGGFDFAAVSVTIEAPEPVELSLGLSPNLAPGETGTAQLEITVNSATGVAALARASVTAPQSYLVAVSAEGGLVRDGLSGSFSDTSFVLARDIAAGTTGTIDVAIKGTAGPRSTLGAKAELADTAALTDIAARVTALQPSFVAAPVASRIEANLVATFGETIGTLTDTLAARAIQFETFGLNTTSATAALAFAIEAAGDFGSLEERGQIESLGQGWSTLADIGLAIDGTSVQVRGLTDIGALRALSVDAAALYTVSTSAGRSVALSGDVLALAAPSRPVFEQGRDGQFRTAGAFDGRLVETPSGFTLHLADGDALLFDAAGNFVSMDMRDGRQIIAAHDAEMQITGLSGPNGAGLTFTRDTDGRLQSVADTDGQITTFGYDGGGKLQTVSRPEGDASFEYNADGDLTKATAPGNITGAFTYDAFGRLDNAIYGNGAQTEDFAYDDRGSLTITDGAGRSTQLDLLPGSVVGRITDGAGGASQIIYDESGAISGVRAPDGTETGFDFDAQGRLTKITDANGAELGFTYGDSGEEPTSFTDAGGNTRSFAYDAGGRITQATWPDGSSLAFDYDGEGNLTGYTNRRGDDVTYTYDARGRLLSESGSSAGPTTYTYDASGRLTSATNDQGTTSLAYDSADRVIQIDYPTGKSFIYTYNDAGLRASMSDGGDYNVFYDYDALGRLTGLRDEDSQIVAYDYDGAGNLVQETNGNGTVSLFTYDDAGRLTRIENQAPDESINSFNAYTYDAAGQRVVNETQDGTWTYGYDAIGQLTSAEFASSNADIADKSLTYEYDGAGNRTRVVEDGVETLYTANALNQYTQVGDATFTYDADGNMTSRTDGEGTTTYTYDLDNRLTAVTEADGTVLEFDYDMFGNRVGKTVDGAETEYLVGPFGLGNVVSEFTDGALSATYAHGLGLAAGEIGGIDAYYDADAVGTVTTLTSVGGSVRNSYVFTPFGSEISEVEGLANDFEFNGVLGVAEDTNDLTFMRARSYSDELGRFLSEDPRFISGDLENFYSFAFQNPVQFADPDGEIPLLVVAALWILAPSAGATGYGLAAAATVAAAGSAAVAGYGLYNSYEFGEDLGEAGAKVAVGMGTNDRKLINEGGAEVVTTVAENLLDKRIPGSDQLKNIVKGGLEAGSGVNINQDAADLLNDFQELATEKQRQQREERIRQIELLADDMGGQFNPPKPPRKPTFEPPEEQEPVFLPPKPAQKPANLGGLPSGASDGDPHLQTFDGVGYSFQAVGEFTLVAGDGFEIQTRQEAINESVSVNSATVMNIGDNVVGVYAKENIPLVINGTAVALERGESIAVGGGSVYRGFFGGTDQFGVFDVYTVTDENGNGFWTNVYFGANHLRPFVTAGSDIAGLLGNLNGDRSDDFQLRDGTVIAQPLPTSVLYGEFADSWRIDQSHSLFVYRDDEDTETFTDRDFPTNIVTLDDLDPEVRQAAEAIAVEAGLVPGTFQFETTVLDIAITGDPVFAQGVAGAPVFVPEGAEEIEIIPVELNEAPTANLDTADVAEDGTVTIDVLANDTDPEGDLLTILGAGDVNGGTVEIVDNKIVFTPAPGYNGDTIISYQLGDAAGNAVLGTVTVDVGAVPDAPVAVDDAGEGFATDKDTRVTLADFLANDVDEDGDVVSLVSVDTASLLGTLIANGDGTFDYDPGGAFDSLGAGQSATDSFAYLVTDGNGGSDDATVTITISNDETLPTPGDDVLQGTSEADVIDLLAGNDTYNGFGGDDLVIGGAGNDDLIGGTGDDVLVGGSGDDTLDGGDGSDTVSYATAPARVTVFLNRSGEDVGGNQGRDTFLSIENVIGSNFNDRLNGTDGDNVLYGGRGNDILTGLGGDDTLNGGLGDDSLTGSGGNDLLFGGPGDDVLQGLSGADLLDGGEGQDLIEGGLGVDTILGGSGDDDIFGFFGTDWIEGGDGDDNIRADGSGDVVYGGAGNDRLVGANGRDILSGGAGNDVLFGGDGFANGDGIRDVFVFKTAANGGGGFDIIRDFEDTTDKLDLSDFGFASFEDVAAMAYDTQAGMKINLDGAGIIRLDGFALDDFTAGDLIL